MSKCEACQKPAQVLVGLMCCDRCWQIGSNAQDLFRLIRHLQDTGSAEGFNLGRIKLEPRGKGRAAKVTRRPQGKRGKKVSL